MYLLSIYKKHFRKVPVLKTVVILLCIPAISLTSLFPQTGKETLRRIIHERMKTQFVKPRDLTCLPASKVSDKKLEKEIIEALIRRFPEVKPDEIVRIVFTMKNWRINRDEFTTFIKSRYIFIQAVITSEIPGRYYLLELNFMQNNRFMGWFWEEMYLKNILFIDMINEENINIICK